MDLELKDRVVLVTGGSAGIGLACAQAFHAEGARVAVVSRSREKVDRAIAAMPGSIGFAANLVDAEAALAVVEGVEARFGPIDILVNSAGAARRTPPADLSPASYRDAMDAKYFSYINIIDPLVKRMAARATGAIVSVIGNGGKVAAPTHIAGGAANAALMLVTAGLATAYAGKGVRILAVNPGVTQTDRVTEGLKAEARLAGVSEEEALRRSLVRIPMGRAAEPSEIAAVVLFLASNRASYLTGVSISMDGATVPMVV